MNDRLKFLTMLWFVNVAFALVLTAPLYVMLSGTLDYSAMGDKLLKTFDYQWYIEFKSRHHDTLLKFPSVMIMVGLVYGLIQTFLAGGVLAVYNSTEKKSMFIDFFYGCVQYTVRFFKIFLIALVIYLGLYHFNAWLMQFIDTSTRDFESEQLVVAMHVARYLLLIFLFNIISLVFDYTKIKIVVDNSHKAFADVWATVKFVMRHFGNTLGLYLVISIVGWGLLLFYFFVEGTITPDSHLMIFAIFVLEQLYIVAKIWTRLLFYASQLEMFKDLRAEVILTPVEVSSV